MVKVATPSMKEIAESFRSSLSRVVTNPTIAGYRPLPSQRLFHCSKAKGKLALGGNRAGKTVSGATEMAKYVTGQHENQNPEHWPFRGRAIGSSIEDGLKKIIIPELSKWIPPSLLKKGSWEESYDLSARTLTLENDSFIELLTYDQDVQKHAGTSRHGIWFDEEPPEDIFNENMIRLVDVGGVWWMTMTPLIDMSWTYERLYIAGTEGKDKNVEVFVLDTEDNPYVQATELEILTAGMSDEEKNARKHGTYFNLSGGIYSSSLSHANFLDKPIVDSDFWDLYYYKWGHFGMLDHGYTNPTAFHLGAYDENGKIIIYKEYRATKRIVSENAVEILKIISDLELTEKLDYIVADPSIKQVNPINRSSVYQEYAENGLYMVLGNNDVKAGILRMNAMLKEKTLLFTPDNPGLIKELPMYRWAKFASSKLANRRNLQEEPVKKDDHSLDAVRYGVMSRPQLFAPVDNRRGNVMNVPVALSSDGTRIDDALMTPYKTWDHPEIFDETLGTDW